MRFWRMIVAGAVTGSSMACGSSDPPKPDDPLTIIECEPGERRPCEGAPSCQTEATQTCFSNGRGWSACACRRIWDSSDAGGAGGSPSNVGGATSGGGSEPSGSGGGTGAVSGSGGAGTGAGGTEATGTGGGSGGASAGGAGGTSGGTGGSGGTAAVGAGGQAGESGQL